MAKRKTSQTKANGKAQGYPDDHYQRTYDLRDELFGAMAVIAVARDSVGTDGYGNYDLNRALADAYKCLDRIAGKMEHLAGPAPVEASHAKAN